MNLLFHETFDTETDGLPGGWFVENNSNLKMVPAIRAGEGCIELLSAGNKFLPVIPDVADCTVRFRLSVNFSMIKKDKEGGFAFLVSFRYDTVTGRGQTVRIRRNQKNGTMLFESGTMRRNVFMPVREIESGPVADDRLDRPFDCEIAIQGDSCRIDLLGQSAVFPVEPGRGKVAFARQHFFDVLKILAFDIESPEQPAVGEKTAFTIPLPDELTWYPLFCDVELLDYGNCMDVSLSLRGGVRDTVPGEGNYSGKRIDLLTRPYLKTITENAVSQHTVYRDRLVLIPEGLASGFFYGVLNKKPDWPFRRRVRFLKPGGKFDLAFGFESYIHGPNRELAQSPSETVFDLNGNVLYSGLGLTSGRQKIEFLSQPDKEMLRRLPKDDPRYDLAVEFVKNNHYFLDGETPRFEVRVTGRDGVPESFEIALEDAFFRPIRTLKFELRRMSMSCGASSFRVIRLITEPLTGLKCGVWHLRMKSLDPSMPGLTDYCALEIMSREPGAPPPPLLSGLPYLYNSRTETRGLITDGFDPWIGRSVNAPHYLSCANFLPAAARKYQVASTVHAYGREYFLWLSSRCASDWSAAGNRDLIRDADYVNMADELIQRSLLWLYSYCGFVLEKLIEFAREKNDGGFDIPKLENQLKTGRHIDRETFLHLAENYWEEWLDFINREAQRSRKRVLAELRRENPRLKYAQYGPAHIYAGCLKGPDFIRLLQNEKSAPEVDGFWQYEDYPFSCRYELCRGSYFLASALMTLPESRIYPEIYIGGGVGGCGDGAVYYAHPPFGQNPNTYPQRMFQLVFEYRYASAYFQADGFHFWDRCGFQTCHFYRDWNETLIQAWRIVVEHTPVRPVRGPAFVASDASRRAARESQLIVQYPQYRIMDVRNTAAEDVPYIAQICRQQGFAPGFQLLEENIGRLTADNTSLLVLPPLKGMAPETLDKIRSLHEAGVALLACEDVTGLEDLFGVRDTHVRKNISRLRGINGFCGGMTEFCDDGRCTGRYEADTAEVLIEAEIPVLTVKHNRAASAAFFNVPPHLVREDCLHERMSYGKEGISEFMEHAVAELIRRIAPPAVFADHGRVIACHTADGGIIIPVYNPSDREELIMNLQLAPALYRNCTLCGSIPFSCPEKHTVRLRLPPDGSGYLLLDPVRTENGN